MKAIIFDMDGTLLDSARAHAKAFKKVLGEQGFQISEQDVIDRFGMHSHEIVKQIAPNIQEEKIVGVIKAKNKVFRKHLRNGGVSMKQGVKKTLKKLKKKGFKLGIASSDVKRNLVEDVKKFGLQALFDTITSAQEFVHPKPHPEQLRTTAQKMGVKPEECVMVGDSKYDVIAAKRAGMKTVLVLGTLNEEQAKELEPDHAIKKMEEVLNII